MNDQEALNQLQQSWPETEDYLQRVGQVNNDLMVLRELRNRDEYEKSQTWLDLLAVSQEDLTAEPTAVLVLKFLWRRGITVKTLTQFPIFQELQEELNEQNGEHFQESILEDPSFELPDSIDAQVWTLPELHKKLVAWAAETAARHEYSGAPLSLQQATILMLVTQVLEQEPEQSPGWAAECLRSALSSDFFLKAANPTS